jgi:glycosyltransferase involved in cell wall biosynthesis
VPLIASAVGGLKDFLRHGENALLFEDNNVDDLCQVYAELDAVRTKLIANGKLTAQEYNWQSLAEVLTTIYRELIK